MAKAPLEFEAKVNAAELNKLLRELAVGADGAAKAINDALGGTVTKKLVLETRADESGAKRLVAVEKERLSVAGAIENQLKQIRKVESGSVTSLRQQVNEARQARDAIAKYKTSIEGVSAQVKTLNPLWAQQNNQVAALERQLDAVSNNGFWSKAKGALKAEGFISFLNGLTEITQGLQSASIVIGQITGSINSLINTSAELQSFALSFKAIGAGAGGASEALQESSRIALGLGVNIETVQEGFRQLSPVILNSGGNLENVSAIIEALNSRFAAFGIAGDRARRVTNGVIQAFAKGKLQAEELTQQISEADPAFKTDLAGALDISVAKLEEFVKAGKLTTDVLIETLPRLSKADLLFGKLGPTAGSAVDALEKNAVTIDQVRGNLENLNKLSLRNLALVAEPLINAFLRAQAVVTDFFTRISQGSSVKTLTDIFARLVTTLSKTLDSFLTLVEGITRVLDAIAPFVDAILEIPGAAELAGVALIGKFLKPLGLLDAAITKSLESQKRFVGQISSIWKGSQESISIVRNSIVGVSEALEQKPDLRLLSSSRDGIKGVQSDAKSAVSAVKSIEPAVAGRISASIEATETKIERLRRRLRLIALESQIAAPTAPAQAVIDNKTEKQLGRTSQAFQQTLVNLERYNSGLKTLGTSSRVTADNLANPALVIRELRDQLGEPIFGRALAIRPEFLRDVQELAKTDPAKSITLLQSALRSLRKTSRETEASLVGLTDEGRVSFRAQTIESANQIKAAIAGITREANNADAGGITRLSGAQIQLNDDLAKTKAEAARLRLELSKEPDDRLARKVGTDQNKIRAELDKTITRQQALYAELDRVKSAGQASRRQQIGFEPGQIQEGTDNLSKYVKAVQETKQQEIIASNSRIAEINKSLEANKKALDEIDARQRQSAKAAQSFRVPVGPIEISRGEAEQAQRLRDEVAKLTQERSALTQQAVAQAAAETNLNKILDEGSKATATYAERNKALALGRDVLLQGFRATGAEMGDLRQRLTELQDAKTELLKRQAARPFLGPINLETDKVSKGIRELNGQIDAIKARLAGLDTQRGQFSQGLEQLRLGFLENEKTAGTFKGQLQALRSGVGNFVKGLTVSPLKAFGGAMASAGGAAFALLQSLGPLVPIFLAVGIASRAYTDGNREASEAAKRLTDQTETLKKAIADLNPEFDTTTTASSKLGLVWEAFSLSVANLGDGIGKVLNQLADGFAGLLQQLQALLGPLYQVAAGAVLAGGAGGLGALIGLPFGPWGAAVGAVLGVVVAGLIGMGVAADETSIKMEKLKRTTAAIAVAIKEQIPVINELVGELGKLVTPGDGVKPENLGKFLSGIQQVEAAVNAQKTAIDGQKAGLASSETAYNSNIARLSKLRQELQGAERDYKEVSDRFGGGFGTGSQGTIAPEVVDARNKVNKLKNDIKSLEDGTIKLGQANAEAALQIQRSSQELEVAEAKYQDLLKSAGLVTEEQVNLTNSFGKLKAAIKNLENVDDFDLLSPVGRENIQNALSQARALKTVLEELSKTEVEISIEIRELEQSIAESQLKIDLEEGPLREAALAVSQITNEFATAQQELQRTIGELEFAESQGALNAETKAELIERAALKFLEASQKGKAAIVDAARQFKNQLDDTISSYQGLVLDKPEFFTPGEIRQNAKQIEADFKAALNKVRAQTGDWSWGPKLTGKTYQEILKQKKEFIDSRNQAEDLVESIKNLNQVLTGLAAVLARLGGISLNQFKALGLDPNKFIAGAENAQKAITGIGSVAQGAARRYGEIIGEVEAGGQSLVITTDAVTGEVVQLTKEQYNAADAAQALGGQGSAAMAKFGKSVGAVTDGIFGQQQSYKDVVGVVQGAGQQLFLVQDKFNGKIEQLTAAQLREQGIVNNLAQSYQNLGIKIAEASELTGEYLKRQQEQAALVDPTSRAVALNLEIDENTVQNVRDAGAKAGGNWLKAMGEAISQGQIFAPMVLNDLSNKVTDYRSALSVLSIAQEQAAQAQDRYNQAVQTGSSDLLTAAGWLQESNAALDAAEYEANRAADAYRQAGLAASQLGINLDSVLTAGTEIPDQGPRTLAEAYEKARQQVFEFNNAVQKIKPSADGLESGTSEAESNLDGGVSQANNMTTALGNAASQARDIASAITGLDGLNVNVRLNSVPGLWTGGPARAGQTYQVNELGQEGFLSASGRLSAINKPRNALWKAPSSGTVIPAHIWSGIDAPAAGVRVTGRPGVMTGGGGNPLAKAVRAIQASLGMGSGRQELAEIARVQAHQATQIGKLASAVKDFASKDWNVHVGVRNTGNAAFLDMVNYHL